MDRRVRGLITGMIAVCFLLAGPSLVTAGDLRLLQQSTRLEPPSAGMVLAEAGGGVVAGAIVGAGLGLGLAELLVPNPYGWAEGFAKFGVAVFGGTIGYAAGCPLGVWGAGTLGRQRGRFLPALLGSATGMVGAAGLGALTSNFSVFALSAVALPPIGAVVGYNMSRTGAAEYGRWSRLGLPVVSMSGGKRRGERWDPAFDFRLVNVRP